MKRIWLSLALVGLAASSEATVRQATFEARHEIKFTAPEGAKALRAWIALPQEDAGQDVRDLVIESPYPVRITRDTTGNRVLHLDAAGPFPKEFSVVEKFTINRREIRGVVDPALTRPLTEGDRALFAEYLAPHQHVVIDDRIRGLAREITGTEQNPVRAARKIYDWVLANIDYWVKDPKNKKASPVGSTDYCLTNKTGNCTDFHSLWTSLARASGIPTRMVYGSFFKLSLDGQDADQSYHCWPEFYAPGIGWIVHDVAVADLYTSDVPLNDDNRKLVTLTTADGYTGADPAKVEYFFGSIDERRVVWSRGRDLVLAPAPAAGPVNFIAKAHVEFDGAVSAEKTGWTRKLSYKEVKGKP